MKNLEPTFLRRFQVFVALSEGGERKCSEAVTITIGFSGSVDPDSGMILNLSDVDAWIFQFKRYLSKKKYLSRWAFCKSVRMHLIKQIGRHEFTQAHFEFHDMFVKYKERETSFGWNASSLIKAAHQSWRSPVTITLKPTTKHWPPLSKNQQRLLRKQLEGVQLPKKWKIKGAIVESFEYIDLSTELKVRI